MALNLTTFIEDLKDSFQQTTWEDFATEFANVVDAFIQSGSTTTTVAGIVTPPLPAPPYPAVGVGTANSISTSGKEVMRSTIEAKITNSNTTWSDLGVTFGNAIDTDVKTGTITTTVAGVLVGVGVGAAGCIDTSATLAALISELNQAFTSQAFAETWNDVATKIATAIYTYLTGATVATVDSGTIPPNSWVGTGTGSIN